MDIDSFMETIEVANSSLKEAVVKYARTKGETTGETPVTLVEVLNVQTAYIDKLRLLLLNKE